MRCPNCQSDNPDDGTFCVVCGVRLNNTPPSSEGQPTIVMPTLVPPQTPAAPAATPIAQPVAPPPRTTGLALSSMIIGIVTLSLMTVAVVLAAIGVVARNSLPAGIGFLFAFPALITSPIAMVLGFIAALQKSTQETPRGRRDALIGVIAGLVTLLLCCVIVALAAQLPTVE
jgi:hypothetical protein